MDNATDAKNKIDGLSNLTPDQKSAAKAKIDQDADAAKKNVDNATDTDGVNKAQTDGSNNINNDTNAATSDDDKDGSKAAIDKAASDAKAKIDASDMPQADKDAKKKLVDDDAAKAKSNIDNDTTTNGVDQDKQAGIDKINGDTDDTPSDADKAKAKAAIDDAANDAKKKIDGLSDLTPDQKATAKAKIDTDASKAKKAVDDATTPTDMNKGTDDGNDAIKNDVKDAVKNDIDNNAKSATDKINGMDNLTPDQKKQAIDKINSDANNAKGAVDNSQSTDDATNAGTNGKKNVFDDTKDAGHQDINNAVQNGINKINGMSNLTPAEKQAAIDKLKADGQAASDNLDKSGSLSDITNSLITGDAKWKVDVKDNQTTNDSRDTNNAATPAAKVGAKATPVMTKLAALPHTAQAVMQSVRAQIMLALAAMLTLAATICTKLNKKEQ
ncbi:DUF1542 domain-containing protein [Fructobacillus parabroussonetiae]|uniref:DUF1542 domain-containing protein n=1 Tax=Fructobacillus parabroussonetiae TaxID=2713174 RepID=UPI00324269E8